MKSPLVYLVAGLCLSASAFAADVPITRFLEVSPGIYRGARPDLVGMNALMDLGVKTDLDLEDNDSAVAAEAEAAKSLGISFISKPMSGFWAPNDQEVNDILSIVGDASRYPIFIHCQHGEDRTGLIVGLYRVFDEKWTPAQAYEEMKADGFHPLLVFLNHYFEKKTGFED